jgi:predicted small metal-binding protein
VALLSGLLRHASGRPTSIIDIPHPQRYIPVPSRKELTMAKVLKCGDIVPGCDFEMTGNSEEEVLQKAAEHAKTDHGMDSIPPEVLDNVRGAIHDEGEARAKGAGAD